MSVRLYADELRCAIYEEAPGGGDPLDPNSQMNRPVVSPLSWIPNLYFHSDLNYYRIAGYASVNISHATIPGITRTIGEGSVVQFYGQAIRTSHVLITHNLGYVPLFFCLYQGRMIPHATPVQDGGTGKKRFVTAYATTTQILLFEVGYSDNTDLAATTLGYQVIVFRRPEENTSLNQLDIFPGEAIFGRGGFRASEPHLRAVGAGDVLWPKATNRTAAVRNGGLGVWVPNGSFINFQNFNGSLAAPSYINLSSGV